MLNFYRIVNNIDEIHFSCGVDEEDAKDLYFDYVDPADTDNINMIIDSIRKVSKEEMTKEMDERYCICWCEEELN